MNRYDHVSKPAQGFVLPVVLAVGLIVILLGVMMIERSSQNRITAIAQKANTRSSAAAEYGIAQFQALLNRYRPLVTSCSNPTLSASCDDTPPWPNISNAVLDPCGITPNEPIARIRAYANQEWSNASTNPSDGQFRLVSYEYKPGGTSPAIGNGTLVVEGRINPDDAISLARTQVKVDFSITRTPQLGNLPGIWIQQTADALNSVQLLTNVKDSTCPGDSARAALIQQRQAALQPSYAYQTTPGIAFPELPPEGSSLSFDTGAETIPVEAIGNYGASLPSPKQSKSGLEDQNDIKAPSDQTFGSSSRQQPQIASPSATDNRVVVYRVQSSGGQSINLSSSAAVLKVGTGSDTVVLDLEGGLSITGGGKILLTSGSNLIIYARGPVMLTGTGTNPAIEQEGSPSATRTQLYVYPPPPDSESSRDVSLSGAVQPLYLVLFAPASKVTTSAQVRGSIWAKSIEGVSSAVVREDPVSLSDLKLIWPPRISPITTWQRQENS